MAELEKLLCTDSKVESLKKINAIIENSGSGLQLFDTVLKDHVLTYEESKGLALQGTYVYKEALAGSRYGYADFYAKVLEEKESATATEVTLGSSTITMYVATNGHQYYDIANKDVVDAFYSSMGSAWFYGVDTENERVFLPRRNKKRYLLDSKKPTSSDRSWYNIYSDGWCEQGGINYGTGAWGSTTVTLPISYLDAHYTLTIGSTAVAVGDYTSASGSTNRGSSLGNVFNKTKNSFVVQSITDTSWETSGYISIQESREATEDYLYICVGNTTNYAGVTDVVNQGMEILEQVAQKVNVDGTNLNAEGKSLFSSFGMPSDRYIDLTLGASGTQYTAPANGWISVNKSSTGASQYLELTSMAGSIAFKVFCVASGQNLQMSIPVRRGEIFNVYYSLGGTTHKFRFNYAEGEQ